MVTRTAFALLSLLALPAAAQDWGVIAGSGPFVFGDFAESRSRITNGVDTIELRYSLSAATRAGGVAGFERFLNDRLSLRAEFSFTQAPVAVKSSGSDEDSVSVGVGDLSVTALVIPLTFRFNRGGTFRPFLAAGPAVVAYDLKPERATRTVPLFSGTRVRAGASLSGGVEWWISDKWILRGEATDIVSKSPINESDFRGTSTLRSEITTPNNLHTTLGIVFRF